MVKINAVDLKGFKLVLTNGKETYSVATLDSVKPSKPTEKQIASDLKLHLVLGNQWSGDAIADMPEGRVLCVKGSIYSRIASEAVKESKVGSVA